MGLKGNIEQKVKTSVKKAAIKAVVAALLKPVLVLVIGSGIVLAVTALWDSLLDSFSKETGATMESRPVEYEANTKDETGASKYAIKITDEQIEDMEKLLEDMGTSKEKLHLYKELEKDMSDEEVEECKKAYLKKIYAAEVISKEINRSFRDEGAGPQLYPEDPEKYYGRVYVQRVKDDRNSTQKENLERLCYIDYDSFFQLDANHIMRYFTIKEPTEDDPYDRLCVASTTVTRDEITGDILDTQITVQEINYKKDLMKYMTPVEFLLDLAIITENPEFVAAYSDNPDLMGLAERILKDTEIQLTVMTTTTKTTTTTEVNYQIETESRGSHTTVDEDGNVIDSGSFGPTKSEPVDADPEITKISVTEKMPMVAVTYVNTWFLEQEYIYNRVKLDPVTIGPDTKSLNPSSTAWSEWQKEPSGQPVYDENAKTTTTTEVYSRSHEINRTQTITKLIEVETFVPGILRDPRYKIDEILKLLRTEFIIPETFVKQAPIGKIVNGAGTLLNMLSGSERTQSVEHIMRYVLYVYTGEDYGVTELNSNIFESNGYLFNSATAASDLTTYLRQFAHSNEAPQSANGQYYQMYGDGAGWPTIGNADLQWKSHHEKFNVPGRVYDGKQEMQVESVEEYVNGILGRGASATYSDDEIRAMQIYIEKELVDSIGSEVANKFYNKVLNDTQGLNLSRQQLYALTAIAHNFGHLPERNGKTFKQVYEEGAAFGVDSWEQNRYIWDNWWCYLGGGMAGHIPARDASFETYVKGVYDFSQSAAGKVFGRNYYIYYTREQLAMYSYAPQKQITRDPNNQAHEIEIFTSTQNSPNTNGIVDIDNSEYGTYTNSQGRTFVEFKQGTGPWSSMEYAGGTIAHQGCSITCLAIVASGYGYNYTPDKWAGPNEVSIDGSLKEFLPGSHRVRIGEERESNSVTFESDKAAIQEHLKHDAVIIHVLGAKYNGNNPFTTEQHWMVLLDVRNNGSEVYVSNPGSRTNGWVNIDEVLKSLCCYITVSQ